jgi:hypothetical protein
MIGWTPDLCIGTSSGQRLHVKLLESEEGVSEFSRLTGQ